MSKEKEAGRMHLAWCCRLNARQLERGACFVHEHPAGASSWGEPCVDELMIKPGLRRIVADKCHLGQETGAGDPINKPIGFMSNSLHLLSLFERR